MVVSAIFSFFLRSFDDLARLGIPEHGSSFDLPQAILLQSNDRHICAWLT
jgi:hypothetical protein